VTRRKDHDPASVEGRGGEKNGADGWAGALFMPGRLGFRFAHGFLLLPLPGCCSGRRASRSRFQGSEQDSSDGSSTSTSPCLRRLVSHSSNMSIHLLLEQNLLDAGRDFLQRRERLRRGCIGAGACRGSRFRCPAGRCECRAGNALDEAQNLKPVAQIGLRHAPG
jgi:hypothetical protein